jgi:uncharacterized protein (TIRG00374 family)
MPRARKSAFLLLKLTVSGGLLYLFCHNLDVSKLIGMLLSIPLLMLIPLFAVQLFNSLISTVKWHIFLSASGLKVRFRRLFSTYLAGSFLNIFLPSNVGGDVYRIYDAGVKTADAARTTASVLADRISGFLAIVILGLIGALSGVGASSNPAIILIPLAVFGGLVALTAMIYQKTFLTAVLKGLRLTTIKGLVSKLDAFFEAFQEYRAHPRIFLKVMSISFLFQLMAIFFAFLMSVALGLEIPFILFCIYVPLISLLEAVPLTIFGLGFRDAGYVFFMTSIGQTNEAAISMSLLYVLLTLLYSSIGGVILAARYAARTVASDEK